MLLLDIIFVESLDKHRRLLFGKGGLIKENRIWSDGPWCANIRKKKFQSEGPKETEYKLGLHVVVETRDPEGALATNCSRQIFPQLNCAASN
jgi:hypothetical protein